MNFERLKTEKLPEHIGIIMDGNRRYSKWLLKQAWLGHKYGAKKVKEVMKWCEELGIKHITIYSLSLENFSRPKKEFDFLMNLFEKEFLDIANNPEHDAHKYKTKINVFGRIYLLPEKVRKAIFAAEESTKNYKNHFLNIAIAYGGQQEITDAMIKIAKKVSDGTISPEQVNEKLIRHSLYTNSAPYPDMIIRTGGEKRLSNFLLWQSAYSELFFVDKMWPEFTKEDFLSAIEEFKNRQRRFGK